MGATTTGAVVEAALFVHHRGERKMVGKLVQRGGRFAFLHAHGTRQFHGQTKCPSPIDRTVLRWLEAREVTQVYCYDRDKGILRRATVAAILDAQEIVQDGRRRCCLPDDDWARLEDVSEGRRGRLAVYAHPTRGVIIATPHLRTEITIEADDEF